MTAAAPPFSGSGQTMSAMALTVEEAEFFAATHVPVWEENEPVEPFGGEDTLRDAHAPLAGPDDTWVETPLPAALPELEDEDPHRARRGPGPWRVAAAGIFAVLVAVALLSTTRRSPVPTAHAAEPVAVAHKTAPLPAIPAATPVATNAADIEILPTPKKLIETHATSPSPKAAPQKPKAKSVAVSAPAKPSPATKPAPKKGAKLKSSF